MLLIALTLCVAPLLATPRSAEPLVMPGSLVSNASTRLGPDSIDFVSSSRPPCAVPLVRLSRPLRRSSPLELVRLEEASVHSGAWQVRALVTSDGRWQGRGGHGTLAAPDLERLRAAIASASFRRVAHPFPCEAEPTVRYHLSAGGRSISWTSPCGSEPEPSVVELERLLGDLSASE